MNRPTCKARDVQVSPSVERQAVGCTKPVGEGRDLPSTIDAEHASARAPTKRGDIDKTIGPDSDAVRRSKPGRERESVDTLRDARGRGRHQQDGERQEPQRVQWHWSIVRTRDPARHKARRFIAEL